MDVIGGVLMRDNANTMRLIAAAVMFIASTSIVAKSSITELTKGQVDDIFVEVNDAFDKAEDTVLKVDPKPNPNPEPVGPDPDPKKCICRGTGVITHGDGHTTPCPYHKKSNNTTGCKDDCKGNCDETCSCGSVNAGCIKQVSAQKEESPDAVKKEYKYTLHVFSANFCGPCKQLDRDVWQSLVDPKKYNRDSHKEMKNFLEKNSIQFKKHIWEKDKSIFQGNAVDSFPTVMLVKDGKVIMRTRGYHSKGTYKMMINTKISER